jgi:hypothetical protein
MNTALTAKTHQKRRPRSGISLVETLMAFSLGAMLLTPVVGLLHTTREVWELCDSDRARLNALHATLRHVSRKLTSAQQIVALEARPRMPAHLQFQDYSGQITGWKHNSKEQSVSYSLGRESGLLADNIDSMVFSGLTIDGKPTRNVRLMRSIQCTVSVRLSSNNQEIKSASCWVTLRQ